MRRSWRERGTPPRRQRYAPLRQQRLTVESPYAPITIPAAACLHQGVRRLRPQCSPLPQQQINIPQPEHGGNGENFGVVNQWLLRRPVRLAELGIEGRLQSAAGSRAKICCTKASVRSDFRSERGILLTVRGSMSFCPARGAKDLCDD